MGWSQQISSNIERLCIYQDTRTCHSIQIIVGWTRPASQYSAYLAAPRGALVWAAHAAVEVGTVDGAGGEDRAGAAAAGETVVVMAAWAAAGTESLWHAASRSGVRGTVCQAE